MVVAAGGPGQPPTIIQQAVPTQVQLKQEGVVPQQIQYQIVQGPAHQSTAVPIQLQVSNHAHGGGIQMAPAAQPTATVTTATTNGNVVPASGIPVPFVGTGEGLFCPECKNPFANKYSLMKHLRSTR